MKQSFLLTSTSWSSPLCDFIPAEHQLTRRQINSGGKKNKNKKYNNNNTTFPTVSNTKGCNWVSSFSLVMSLTVVWHFAAFLPQSFASSSPFVCVPKQKKQPLPWLSSPPPSAAMKYSHQLQPELINFSPQMCAHLRARRLATPAEPPPGNESSFFFFLFFLFVLFHSPSIMQPFIFCIETKLEGCRMKP